MFDMMVFIKFLGIVVLPLVVAGLFDWYLHKQKVDRASRTLDEEKKLCEEMRNRDPFEERAERDAKYLNEIAEILTKAHNKNRTYKAEKNMVGRAEITRPNYND